MYVCSYLRQGELYLLSQLALKVVDGNGVQGSEIQDRDCALDRVSRGTANETPQSLIVVQRCQAFELFVVPLSCLDMIPRVLLAPEQARHGRQLQTIHSRISDQN